jgi:hypothetical protein
MAKYSEFQYGSGVKYGGLLSTPDVFKLNMTDPDRAHGLRHIKVTVKYTTGAQWAIDSIRLHYARREHLIPKWIIPVNRLLKRTKVTLKYTTDEMWAIDSLRLHQKIKHRGPTV